MRKHAATEIDFNEYFTGQKLIGDDYSVEQVKEWYSDEAEGYADLGAKDKEAYSYAYHVLNEFHGYRHFQTPDSAKILGFGSAYGDELRPLLTNTSRVTIIEPSEHFRAAELEGVSVDYVKPSTSGTLPFKDDMFDVVTCLGVLHHIPNVSYVVKEIGRVLRPGGHAIFREPVVNMGDWRKPRKGLTRRERGIPIPLLEIAFEGAALCVEHRAPCVFPLTQRVASAMGVRQAYNSWVLTRIDSFLCRATSWNWSYHRPSILKKLCPTSYYWVCRADKPSQSSS